MDTERIVYVGDKLGQSYSGFDSGLKRMIHIRNGEAVTVSREKAEQLFRDFGDQFRRDEVTERNPHQFPGLTDKLVRKSKKIRTT